MTNETAIQTTGEGPNFLALTEESDAYRAAAAENLMPGDEIGPENLTRIVYPRDGRKFSWETANGEVSAGELTGVVIDQRVTRTYYSGEYDPGNIVPPDCASADGVYGNPSEDADRTKLTNDQGSIGVCMKCPMNDWGSGSGAGKACTEYRHIVLLQPDERWPVVLRLPPTQLGAWKRYITDATMRGIPMSRLLVTLSIGEDRNLKVRAEEGLLAEEVSTRLRSIMESAAQQVDEATAPEMPDAVADDSLPF